MGYSLFVKFWADFMTSGVELAATAQFTQSWRLVSTAAVQ